MKKTSFLFLVLLLIATDSQAQSDERRASTSFSVGLGGQNVLLGLNYNQLVVRRKNYNLGFQIGLPLSNAFDGSFLFGDRGKGGNASINFLYGQEMIHFEMGAGGGVFHDRTGNYPTAEIGLAWMATAYAGLRIQKPSGGLFFRAGLSPSWVFRAVREDYRRFLPLPLVEIGFTLPNGYRKSGDVIPEGNEEIPEPKIEAPFRHQLTGAISMGVEFNSLAFRGTDVVLYRPDIDSRAKISNKTVLPAWSTTLQIEWRPSRQFALSAAPSFRTLNMRFHVWGYFIGSGLPNVMLNSNLKMKLSSLRIPVQAKFIFGKRTETAITAGIYLNLNLAQPAEGNYSLLIGPSTTYIGDVATSQLSLPVVGESLQPEKVQWGPVIGAEWRHHISEKHSLLLRTSMGGDLSKLYSLPSHGTAWFNAQVGYGFRFR